MAKEYRQNAPYNKNGIFREEDHPRDEAGKFTKSGGDGLSTREKARFYKKIGEIKRGGVFARTKSGDYLIPLHKMSNDDKPTLIISTGDYESPIVKKVFRFKNEGRMFETMEEFQI